MNYALGIRRVSSTRCVGADFVTRCRNYPSAQRRAVVGLHPSLMAMAFQVCPWERQRLILVWRDSVAHAKTMQGSSSRANAHAAKQVIVMAEMMWVSPGGSALACRFPHILAQGQPAASPKWGIDRRETR